jgi:acyl carrier protein
MNTEGDFSYSVFLGLKEIIERVKQRKISNLEWGTNLIKDLEMDSLDMMELKLLIQRKYP